MTCCWGSFFMKAVQLQIQIENLTQSNIQSRLCILKAQQFKYFPNPSAGETTTCSCCRRKHILLLHAGQSSAAGEKIIYSFCRGNIPPPPSVGNYTISCCCRENLLLQGRKATCGCQAADQSVSSAADQSCAAAAVVLQQQLCSLT